MIYNNIYSCRQDINSLVSVIIPCFNSSSFIGRTIKSVLNQSYPYFEILIIDDCSNDYYSLEKEISLFHDSRIFIYRLSNKRYAAGARNEGVRFAKGKYIAYLDSDDEWYRDKLLRNIEKIEQYYDKDVVLYSLAQVLLPDRQLIIPKRKKFKDESVTTYKVIKHGNIFTPTIFLKKSTAEKVCWNESLIRNHEDFLYCLELEETGAEFICIEEPLVRIHWDKGRSTRIDRKNWNYSLNFITKYKKYFTRREAKYFIFDNIFINLLENKQLVNALRILYCYHLSLILFDRLPQICISLMRKVIISLRHFITSLRT